MTVTKNAYQLDNVQHFYGSKKVLDISNLEIDTGIITGITGPNGSGKSTLLKLLAFVEKPTSGHILYNGRPEIPFSENVRSKVTLLTQKPYLLKRSVFENVAYGLRIRKDIRNLQKRIQQALDLVGLKYDDFAFRMWHELSGGEAQRVALAARLILKPDVLLLDEPIASVDIDSAKLIREASINAKQELGTTLVIVSHDMHWLYSISDQQFSIYNGTLFTTGMENVIAGPFVRTDNQMLSRKLSDGQQILARTSQMKKATAIIRKKHITLDLKKQAAHPMLNQLDGHLTAMMLEKKTGFILATILCCDLSFVLRLTPEQIDQFALYPGKKVVLKFLSTDIEWV